MHNHWYKFNVGQEVEIVDTYGSMEDQYIGEVGRVVAQIYIEEVGSNFYWLKGKNVPNYPIYEPYLRRYVEKWEPSIVSSQNTD